MYVASKWKENLAELLRMQDCEFCEGRKLKKLRVGCETECRIGKMFH